MDHRTSIRTSSVENPNHASSTRHNLPEILECEVSQTQLRLLLKPNNLKEIMRDGLDTRKSTSGGIQVPWLINLTEYQLADMFTKALPEDRFKYLVRRIGMRCLTPAELEVLTNETA
ncbi:hypothetical protein Tco_1448715 [Tanacetum coccineum]